MAAVGFAAALVALCASASAPAEQQKSYRVSAIEDTQVWLEGGLLDGLAEGMHGDIYYEITVAGQKKRIIPAKVVLTRVQDRQSIGAVQDATGTINVGYHAALVPRPPNDLLIVYNTRGMQAFTAKDFNLAKQFYQRILEALPGDPFAGQRVKECDAELEKLAAIARERRNVPYYRTVLATTLDSKDPDLALARTYIEKILALMPGDPEALRIRSQVEKIAPAPKPEPSQAEPARIAEKSAQSQSAPPQVAEKPASQMKAEPPKPEPVKVAEKTGARVKAEPPKPEPAPVAAAPPPAPKPLPPPLLKDMVFIPESRAQIGSEPGRSQFANESPQHAVLLPAYYIDKYEVTNEDYKRFCNATGRSYPGYFINGAYPEGTGRRPVVMVSWIDADAYARWAGKRLPTEEEWEAAAAGTSGSTWPWGNAWDPTLANTREGTGTDTADGGSFPGDFSLHGVYDMAGNVSEWTADWYKPYPGNTRREKEYGEKFRVLRGGSVKTSREFARSQFRARLPDGFRSEDLGFRCAVSAKDVR